MSALDSLMPHTLKPLMIAVCDDRKEWQDWLCSSCDMLDWTRRRNKAFSALQGRQSLSLVNCWSRTFQQAPRDVLPSALGMPMMAQRLWARLLPDTWYGLATLLAHQIYELPAQSVSLVAYFSTDFRQSLCCCSNPQICSCKGHNTPKEEI